MEDRINKKDNIFNRCGDKKYKTQNKDGRLEKENGWIKYKDIN